MKVEVEGVLDARNARRVLEALEAFRAASAVQLDFRRVQRVEREALALLVEGVGRLEHASVRCEGLAPTVRAWLRMLGRDPVSLRPVSVPMPVPGRA